LERIETELDCPDAELVSYLSGMTADYLSVDGQQVADISADRGSCVPSQPDADLFSHQPPLTYISPISHVLAKEVSQQHIKNRKIAYRAGYPSFFFCHVHPLIK
jgi:hypothetical protein